uniref:Uncharacterized protein n=1 Tax=Lotus japonicus TaxID=34305 RepID=I3SKY2_LOTJA|nr:unknown [Lotus japonicus]
MKSNTLVTKMNRKNVLYLTNYVYLHIIMSHGTVRLGLIFEDFATFLLLLVRYKTSSVSKTYDTFEELQAISHSRPLKICSPSIA